MLKIAYTMAHGRGELDMLLTELAEHLHAQGVRTRGIVQKNTGCETEGRCDMDVQVLPDGPVIRISQYLGKGARGCRLDPDAMAQAISEVARTLDTPYDLFLLNKFGKEEGEGRGFRNLLAEAAAGGAVIIAGTNPLNADKFKEFSGGEAVCVEAELDALLRWYKAVSAS